MDKDILLDYVLKKLIHFRSHAINASFQNVLCEMFFLIVTVSLHYICFRDDRSCNCNINGTNMENSAVSLGTLVIMLTLIMFSTSEQKEHASNRVRFYCIASVCCTVKLRTDDRSDVCLYKLQEYTRGSRENVQKIYILSRLTVKLPLKVLKWPYM